MKIFEISLETEVQIEMRQRSPNKNEPNTYLKMFQIKGNGMTQMVLNMQTKHEGDVRTF